MICVKQLQLEPVAWLRKRLRGYVPKREFSVASDCWIIIRQSLEERRNRWSRVLPHRAQRRERVATYGGTRVFSRLDDGRQSNLWVEFNLSQRFNRGGCYIRGSITSTPNERGQCLYRVGSECFEGGDGVKACPCFFVRNYREQRRDCILARVKESIDSAKLRGSINLRRTQVRVRSYRNQCRNRRRGVCAESLKCNYRPRGPGSAIVAKGPRLEARNFSHKTESVAKAVCNLFNFRRWLVVREPLDQRGYGVGAKFPNRCKRLVALSVVRLKPVNGVAEDRDPVTQGAVSRRIVIESAGRSDYGRHTHEGNAPATCRHVERLA
jgi:hypothetical protein